MKRLVATILLTLIPMLAFAVKVTNLYQAEVVVSSQSDEEKIKAARIGLVQIFTKLTGNTQLANNPEIQTSLKNAVNYVQEFSYSAINESNSQYTIGIKFDKNSVNNLLQKANVIYWRANRPLIVVWLTTASAQHTTEIIGKESANSVFDAMQQQGKKYGLPIMFPILDMTDISLISPEDIKTMNLSLLKEASKRYAASVFLLGNIEETNGIYQSQWQFVLENNNWNWNVTGKTPDEIIATVFNQMSQVFVKHYAVKTVNTPQQWLKLEVSNVTERHDLLQLLQYLKQLSLVQQINLSQVDGDSVGLSILVQGSLTAFQQNASIGQRLVLKSEDIEKNKLIYEWVH